MIKYRVTLKVRYNEIYFDFIDNEEACNLAETLLKHQVLSEDNERKKYFINISCIDTDLEEAVKNEEDEDD